MFQRPSQSPSQSAIFLSELRVVLPLIVLPLKTPTSSTFARSYSVWKKSTKIDFSAPETAGWDRGLPCEEVGAEKFVASLESLFFWVSRKGTWDVPGILPGCPRALGVFKKFMQEKFVLIFRPLWLTPPPPQKTYQHEILLSNYFRGSYWKSQPLRLLPRKCSTESPPGSGKSPRERGALTGLTGRGGSHLNKFLWNDSGKGLAGGGWRLTMSEIQQKRVPLEAPSTG